MTETWVSDGDASPFSELLPANCTYFNSPRITGQTGGGVATVFKNNFKCKQLSSIHFNSFELNMFELGHSHPVLCIVIYRPPQYNKDFINELSELLTEIMPKYSMVLITGDLNVHVCCPTNPLVKEFLNVIEAFNFTQSVSGPTHEHGHTLDLVLTYGISVSNVKIYDATFSDHMPILFELSLPCKLLKQRLPARLARVLKPSTAAQFSVVFTSAMEAGSPVAQGDRSDSPLGTEELASSFLSTCQITLDTVAPMKIMRPKPQSEPWFNDTTRAARQECRRAERKWKKDKQPVSYSILKKSWRCYQRTVRAEKTKHFSDIISTNCHKPRVLFSTINLFLNPPQANCSEPSPETAEAFLHFFVNKITTIRANITPPIF